MSSNNSLCTKHLLTLTSSPTVHITLPFSNHAYDADLIGSCHGLICISDQPNFLALFSPTTKTHHVINLASPARNSESHWLDFGFGYDSSKDDYKVVRVDQFNGPDSGRVREVQVYSLKEGLWRKIEMGFPHFLAHPMNHGKYLNGSIFWMTSLSPPTVYDIQTLQIFRGHSDPTVYKYVIVEFNLKFETFNVIDIPECCDSTGKEMEFPKPWLEVLNDSLCIRYEYGPINERSIDVWLLKRTWLKLFSFPYAVARPEADGRVRPLLVSEDGRKVLIEQNGKFMYFWFNLESGDFRDVKLRGSFPSLFQWNCGHPCDHWTVLYVDSLVTLDNTGLEHAQKPVDDGDNGIPKRKRFYVQKGEKMPFAFV